MKTVLMKFEGDEQPVPVPVNAIAQAKAAGAKIHRPSLLSNLAALANPQSYTSDERMKQIAGETGQAAYNFTADNMPAILGTAATLPFGGGGGLARAAFRTIAGAGGAYGGSMAGDVMQGQAPDLNRAGANFAWALPLGAGGEGLAGASGSGATGLGKSAYRPTEKMLAESPTLVEDALKMGSRVRKPGQPAKEARAIKKQSMKRTEQMVSGSSASISADDALAGVEKLRADIARNAPTDARLPLIDTYIQEFRNKWGAGRIPVEEAHGMKLQAQREARSKFGKDSPGAATRQELDKLVSQDTRLAIGREIPKFRGRRGYNKQDEMTHRAHMVAKATERAARLPRPPAMSAHAAATVAGGLGGYGVHGPVGGAGGVLTLNALLAALENPQISSRLALLLNSGGFKATARNAPRFAAPLVVPPPR